MRTVYQLLSLLDTTHTLNMADKFITPRHTHTTTHTLKVAGLPSPYMVNVDCYCFTSHSRWVGGVGVGERPNGRVMRPNAYYIDITNWKFICN